MSQVAELLEIGGRVRQEIARVVGRSGGGWAVRIQSRVVTARRAASCLLEPAEGDRVLLAVPAQGDPWLLAVLERPGADAHHRLKLDGPLTVESGARLELRGPEVVVDTPRYTLVTKAAKILAGTMDYVGRTAGVSLEVTKVVSEALDVMGERFVQHVKRSYRMIEEMDVTRAEQVDIRASENLHVRAKNAVVQAQQVYKVDAEQIHLG